MDANVDKRHGFNTDSLIRVESHSDLEVLITKISSRFNRLKKDKHSTDHYKSMFELLSMVKAIADR